MNIEQLQRKHAKLTEINNALSSSEFIASVRGEISNAEMERRRAARLQEIADLEQDGAAYKRAVELELKQEANRKKMHRWRKFTQGVWHTKPHGNDPIDYTKGDRAALVALMYASEGRRSFQVAYEWLAQKCGASRSTIKRLVKKLESAGLIEIIEHRIDRERSEWNEFVIKCEKLRNWAINKFSRVGFKSELHLGTLKGSSTTQLEKQPDQETQDSPKCRNNGSTCVEGDERPAKASQDITEDVFVTLAAPALADLGAGVRAGAGSTELINASIGLLELFQPDFKPDMWRFGEKRHGIRRVVLSFLQTRMLSELRKAPSDKRPMNERDVIRDRNKYLGGMLAKPRGRCHPEITLGAILEDKGLIDGTLPPALAASLDRREKQRKTVKRNDDTGELAFA